MTRCLLVFAIAADVDEEELQKFRAEGGVAAALAEWRLDRYNDEEVSFGGQEELSVVELTLHRAPNHTRQPEMRQAEKDKG